MVADGFESLVVFLIDNTYVLPNKVNIVFDPALLNEQMKDVAMQSA